LNWRPEGTRDKRKEECKGKGAMMKKGKEEGTRGVVRIGVDVGFEIGFALEGSHTVALDAKLTTLYETEKHSE
jgi:hypothetical protein